MDESEKKDRLLSTNQIPLRRFRLKSPSRLEKPAQWLGTW
jgi:hypothetical protein